MTVMFPQCKEMTRICRFQCMLTSTPFSQCAQCACFCFVNVHNVKVHNVNVHNVHVCTFVKRKNYLHNCWFYCIYALFTTIWQRTRVLSHNVWCLYFQFVFLFHCLILIIFASHISLSIFMYILQWKSVCIIYMNMNNMKQLYS